MSEIRKQKGESFESLFRNYTKKVRSSGKIMEIKKRRAYKDKPSTLQQKNKARRRKKINSYLTYLKKVGKVNDATPQDEIKKHIKKIKKD